MKTYICRAFCRSDGSHIHSDRFDDIRDDGIAITALTIKNAFRCPSASPGTNSRRHRCRDIRRPGQAPVQTDKLPLASRADITPSSAKRFCVVFPSCRRSAGKIPLPRHLGIVGQRHGSRLGRHLRLCKQGRAAQRVHQNGPDCQCGSAVFAVGAVNIA